MEMYAMRLIDAPIQVHLHAGRPVSFERRGQTYKITRIVDSWHYTGRWWAGEGTWIFLTVQTAGGGVFELYYDTVAAEWRLYRAYD